jgi:glycosyltransferase involved in cell wall biosynthesis
MYALDQGLWGPTVRITNLVKALGTVAEVDVVSGGRSARARSLWRYARAGRLDGLAGIYVESSSFLPGPADLAFLRFARRHRVPVLTYIRDAYPLFPEYANRSSVKKRISHRLFLSAFRSLATVSDVVGYPSEGLARALGFDFRPAVLLPPGAPEPRPVARREDANQLLHVGSLRNPVLGQDILFGAIEHVRRDGLDIGVVCVARPGDDPAGPLPDWVEVHRASGDAIDAVLPRVFATVIPRHRTPYNDLAVPVKVMDYLSYGRPMITTDCLETAIIVEAAGSGLVVGDNTAAFAAAIGELAQAPADVLDRYSEHARRAAVGHSWDHRGRQVLDILLGAV